MEALRLIVQSDPTGELAKFRLSLRETIKPVQLLEGSLHLANAELGTLTGRLAASAAALSSSGLSALAGIAKDAADAILKQAQAERELAQASKESEAARKLSLAADKEASAAVVEHQRAVQADLASSREAAKLTKDRADAARAEISLQREAAAQLRDRYKDEIAAANAAKAKSSAEKEGYAAARELAAAERELAAAEKERAAAVGILKVAEGQLLQDQAKAQATNRKAEILAETEAIKAKTKAEIDLKNAQANIADKAKKTDISNEITQLQAKKDLEVQEQLALVAINLERERAIQLIAQEKAATAGIVRVTNAASIQEEARARKENAKAAEEEARKNELSATAKDRLAISANKAAKSQIDLEQSAIRLNKAREQEAARAAKQLTDADRFVQSLDKEILSLRNQIAVIDLGAAGFKRYEAAVSGAGAAAESKINEWERLKNKLQELKQAQEDQARKLAEEKSARDSLLSGIRNEITALNEEKIAVEQGAAALLAHKAAALGLTNEIKPLAAELQRLQQALLQSKADKAARDFDALAAANPKAAAAVRQTEESLLRMAQSSSKVGESFRRMTESQQALDVIKAKIAAVEAQLKTLAPGSEAARAALERLSLLNIGADKISSDISKMRGNLSGASNEFGVFGEILSFIGVRGLTVVTVIAAIGSAIKKAAGEISKGVATFSRFDDQIRIAASYTGTLDATSESFFRLSQVAKQVGRDTSISATEAAGALTELASKGFSASQQIALMPKEVALAESAQISLKEATETTVKALKAYKLEAEDAGRVNDIISFTAQNSGANVQYLSQAFTQALLAGEGAGLKFEDVAASLAIFGDRAIHAGTASRAMRAVLISMQAPTARMRAEYERLGISLRDSQGNFRGYTTILEELRQKNIGLIEANELFGRYFSTSGLALVDGAEKVKYLIEAYEELNGVTEDTAKFQQEGIGGALRILSGSIDLLYNEIGGLLAPAITIFAKEITNFVNNIASVASVMKPAIETFRYFGRIIVNTYSIFETLYTVVSRLRGIVITGLITPLRYAAEALKSLGVIKENPFKTLSQSISDFSKDVKNSFENLENRGRVVEKAFDASSKAVDDLVANRKKVEEADKLSIEKSNAAAAAAARLAREQGKSAVEALKAAQEARKEFEKQAEEARKAEEKEQRLALSRKKNADEAKKQAEEARKLASEAGYKPEEAQAAYDSVIEAAKKAKDGVLEVTDEVKAQAQAIEDAGGKYDKYTEITGKIEELKKNMKLAREQVDLFGKSSALGAAALSRLASYDLEKTNLSKEAAALKKELGGVAGQSDDAAAAIDNLSGELGGGAEAADALADSTRDIEFNQKKIGTAEVDKLSVSLKNTAANAGEASLKVSSISSGMAELRAPAGGTVSFVATLDASDYLNKSERLKEDIASFKDKNRWILRTEAPEFEPVRIELKRMQDELARNESVIVLTQKMAGLRGEIDATKNKLSETRQVFADGNLTIDTNPQVSAELEQQVGILNEQISLLARQKFVAESTAGAFEIIGDKVSNISPAMQASKAAYDSLRDSSGNIKTEWKEIDGVWKEVLPSGEALLDVVNAKILEGISASGQYGAATSTMFSGLRTDSEGANKILDDLQRGIESTALKSGDLKFNQLADSMTAASALKKEIEGLGSLISEVGQDSDQGRAALKRMLTAQAEEQSINKQISELKKEIFDTGVEAEKTASKISDLGKEVNQAVGNLAQLGSMDGFGNIVSELKAGAASTASSVADASITKLTQTMAVSKALNDEISSLEKYIEAVGPASAEGQKALAKLITAQGIESEAQKKISDLKAEVASLTEVVSSASQLKLLSSAEDTKDIISQINSEVSAVTGSISDSSVEKLASAMSVSEALKSQVDSLGKYINDVGASSDEGREALKKLLEAESASDIAAKKVQDLRNELKGVGEDAASAADSLKGMASATSSSYTFTADNSISGINNKIEDLKSVIQSLESITSYDVDTSKLQQEVAELEAKKFQQAMKRSLDNFMSEKIGDIKYTDQSGNTGNSTGTNLSEASRQSRQQMMQAGTTINNTSNYYAVPENSSTRKQRDRYEAQK